MQTSKFSSRGRLCFYSLSQILFTTDRILYGLEESPHGLVANMLYCDIVIGEFEFQSRYYVGY